MNLTILRKAFLITFGVYMLIGMHYFQPNLGGSGLHLPFNAIGWIFISILMGIGWWQAKIQAELVYSRLSLIFITATLVMLIPLLYADPIVVGLSYSRLLGLIGGLLFFIALQQFRLNQQQRLMLLYLILAAVFVEALFSLVQYYILPINNIVGYNKITTQPSGIFQQSNVAASFLATGIIIALYLLTQTKLHEKNKRLFCYITTVMAVIPLVLLQSRTGYLSLLIAPLMLLPWVYLKLRVSKQLQNLFIWSVCLFLGIAIGGYTLETAENTVRSIYAGEHALTNPGGRLPMYAQSLNMWLEKPLLGWGYGSFEVAYLTSYSEALSQGLNSASPDQNINHPHNELLYWGIEGGLIALTGIALLVIGFLSIIIKQPLWRALALLGLLFPLLLHTQTGYPFYQSIAHWIVFLTLIWYIDSRYSDTKTIRLKYTLLLRTLALLIPLLTTLFMLTTLHTTKLLVQYEHIDQRDITPLTKIINPVAWSKRIEFHAMIYRAQVAMRNNDIAELNNYMRWAAVTSQQVPRAPIYIIWIKILTKLGQDEEAKILLQRTMLLYPINKLVQNFYTSQADITQSQ